MVTIAHIFLNALTIYWVIGGILLLPIANSPTCMLLFSLKVRGGLLNRNEEQMWEALTKIWAFEVAWNIVYMFILLIVEALFPGANHSHPGPVTFEDFGGSLIVAFILPFWVPIFEGMAIAAIFICTSNPLLGAAVYGPTVVRSWQAGVFSSIGLEPNLFSGHGASNSPRAS